MTFDLYVWRAPRDLDVERAEALVAGWEAAGGDPIDSPFEPSSDVGWFNRELLSEVPGLEASSDAAPVFDVGPIWLTAPNEPPARVVALRLPRASAADLLDRIFGLAAKYDLVVYDARNRRLHLPLEEMAAQADATFWPGGAVQATVAGTIGGLMAVAGWLLAIPILSGILVVIGGFAVVMAVYTVVHHGRSRSRGSE